MTGAAAPRLPSELDQARALARIFFGRFFESEATGGRIEPHAIVWLTAALATFSFAIPGASLVRWMTILVTPEPEGGAVFLRMASASERTFALTYTITVAAAIAAVLWPSLLVDRRDVLVLKAHPVRDRTLLAGKIAALVLLLAAMSVAMNLPGALVSALLLGDGVVDIARLFAVHFVTMSAAGAFGFATAIALQGILLAATGPRLFARVSAVAQFLFIAAIGTTCLVSAIASDSAPAALYGIHNGVDSPVMRWFFVLPAAWFLGLYETLRGTPFVALHILAARAIWALAAVVAATMATYPIAYRRVAAHALVGSPIARGTHAWSPATVLPTLLARHPAGRAAVQFAAATLVRSPMHRVIVATAFNVGGVLALAFVAGGLALHSSSLPASLVAAPIAVMFALMAGVRTALAIPSELPAAWVFAAEGGHAWRVQRAAMRRFLWVPCVAISVVSALIYGQGWDAPTGVWCGILYLGVGSLLVEIVMARIVGVPCTKAYGASREGLQSAWPAYIVLAIVLLIVLPLLAGAFLRTRSWGTMAYMTVLLTLASIGVRGWPREAPMPDQLPEPDVSAPGLALR